MIERRMAITDISIVLLNSDEPVFTWQSQHQYDAAPTNWLYTSAGFLNKLDPELAAVLGAVNKQVAKANYDGGGQDTFSDKVFLLSRIEVGLGASGDVTGEAVYSFYDGADATKRVKLYAGSGVEWFLRSPRVDYAYLVDAAGTGSLSGELAYYAACGALDYLSPACVIV